jgi:hypothetical protein
MTEDAKQAWADVAEKFSSWGHRVADRYEGEGSSDAAAEEKTRELQHAAKELIDQLSRGVSALGTTLRDDQANKDLGDAVRAIGEAITATVNEATEGIRTGRKSGDPPGSS